MNDHTASLEITVNVHESQLTSLHYLEKRKPGKLFFFQPPNRAGHYILQLWFLSSFFFFLAYSQRSQIGCLPYFRTWRGLSANLECRSETCGTRLAGNAGLKKSPSHNFCRAIYIVTNKACVNWEKPVKRQYLLQKSSQYGERRPTNS